MQPLGTTLGQKILKVETFSNANGEPIYYVVYLQPSGFVIVSADDLIEPIIAFADDGFFDPSLDNPLGALVIQDLNGRVAAVQEAQSVKGVVLYAASPSPQAKWNHLENLAETRPSQVVVMGLGSVSDIRVEPLIQSRWGQKQVCENDCYNYYTPSHYPSGCFATAIAQIIRYYEHPDFGIGVNNLQVYVDDVPKSFETRGGDGNGGLYNWSLMDLKPDCSTSLARRQAIGALCYDVGLASLTHYSLLGSAIYLDQIGIIGNNLGSIFGYNNGIFGCNDCAQGNWYNIGAGLNGMVNPNLDASYPAFLIIFHTIDACVKSSLRKLC